MCIKVLLTSLHTFFPTGTMFVSSKKDDIHPILRAFGHWWIGKCDDLSKIVYTVGGREHLQGEEGRIHFLKSA